MTIDIKLLMTEVEKASVVTAADLAVGDPYKGGIITEIWACGSAIEIDLDRLVNDGTGIAVGGFVLYTDEVVPHTDLVGPQEGVS